MKSGKKKDRGRSKRKLSDSTVTTISFSHGRNRRSWEEERKKGG